MPVPKQTLPRREEKTKKPGGAGLASAMQVRVRRWQEKRPCRATGGNPAWPQSADNRHSSQKRHPGQPGGGEAGQGMRAAGRQRCATGRKAQPSRWIAPAGKVRRKRSHRPARGEGFGGASFGGLFSGHRSQNAFAGGASRLTSVSQLKDKKRVACKSASKQCRADTFSFQILLNL